MSESDRADVIINTHQCKGCLLCTVSCPTGVLKQTQVLNRQGYYAVAYVGSGCSGCGICFYVCPEPGAIIVRKRKVEKPAKKSESPEPNTAGESKCASC
jgi:NAD-dependent dihydropyrimidine dehydrogenase PreA subunit